MRTLLVILFCTALVAGHSKNKVIYILNKLVACDNITDMNCIQYHEQGEKGWKTLKGQIEGFRFDPDMCYKLEVKDYQVPDAKADYESKRFKLVKVLAKTEAPVEAIPEEMKGYWKMTRMNFDSSRNVADRNISFHLAGEANSQATLVCQTYKLQLVFFEQNQVKFSFKKSKNKSCDDASFDLSMALYDLLSNTFIYECHNGYCSLQSTESGKTVFELARTDL
ncbi:MAG: DUF4377 domain-containing protein [Chitinophagaceae bacterium]